MAEKVPTENPLSHTAAWILKDEGHKLNSPEGAKEFWRGVRVYANRKRLQLAALTQAIMKAANTSEPSDDPAPSGDDIEVTKKVKQTGLIIGISKADGKGIRVVFALLAYHLLIWGEQVLLANAKPKKGEGFNV